MSVFDDLIGQDAAVVELQRAAGAARLIASGQADAVAASAMSQAWLFTGPPGSGRSLAARTLAATLVCEAEVPGCGECAGCKAAMADNHPDLTTVATELVTISADEVRQYVARSYVAPSSGYWRIFIIEDADRMVTRTTNVLLKAIEEPGAHTVWMLCTAAPADVLPTIRSRCRNINLVTPDPYDVAELLVEREGVDPDAALVAAQAAQSHVGVARALATNEGGASTLRTNTLDAISSIRGVGDAAMAAVRLLDGETMRGGATDAKSKKAAKEEAEDEAKRKIMESYGLDPAARLPAGMKSQIQGALDSAKKKETRQQRDMLDRELIYAIGFYRDVLVRQFDAPVDLINADYEQAIVEIAGDTTVGQVLERINALNDARDRLAGNVAPQLAMEAALVALRP